MGQQIHQKGFLALGRGLQERDEFEGLLPSERQRRNAKRGAFGDMGTVGVKHGDILSCDEFGNRETPALGNAAYSTLTTAF
jgi:DUF1680 family protein